MIQKVYLGILLLVLVCKKPSSAITEKAITKEIPSAVVVLVTGNSRVIHSDTTEEKASVGSYFRSGDKIITSDKSRVDVQIHDGAIIRVSANTSLEFSKLVMEGVKDVKLSLEKGKLFAKVTKKNKDDSFQVVSPSFVAGIRGTEFIIDLTKEKSSTVKVLDGSVAVKPRSVAIEIMSAEELGKSNVASEVDRKIDEAEIVIDKNFQATLPNEQPVLAKDKLEEEDKSNALKAIDKFKQKPILADLSKSEEQELSTMILENIEVLQEMTAINEELTSGKVDEKRAEELEARRGTLENELLKKQDKEKSKFTEAIIKEPKKLKTKKAIVKYYERIEKIILGRGRVEVGAIISQEGDTIIIHTESGIRRIPKDEVQEVIYEYQNRSRF